MPLVGKYQNQQDLLSIASVAIVQSELRWYGSVGERVVLVQRQSILVTGQGRQESHLHFSIMIEAYIFNQAPE